MSMSNLRDLYINELKDLYNAENQLIKALPQMAENTTNIALRAAFDEHLKLTREHATRLETIFEELEVPPTGKKCIGMAGLIEEGSEMLKEDADPDVRDAAIIGAAQRVEHYDMAAYGTVRTFADQLGFEDHSRLLEQTLREEEEADKLLSRIAEDVNREAESRRMG
jgi:ferritin-like metal-binding protein YciE